MRSPVALVIAGLLLAAAGFAAAFLVGKATAGQAETTHQSVASSGVAATITVVSAEVLTGAKLASVGALPPLVKPPETTTTSTSTFTSPPPPPPAEATTTIIQQ